MIRTAKCATLAVLVLSLLSIAFQVVVVPTASMERTVLVGDHLLIDRFAYGPKIPFTHIRLPRLKTPGRGEVVSFHPPTHPEQVFLKRVVAVGGDRVESQRGKILVNGREVNEPYTHCSPCGKDFPELTVPQGKLYVLGDNRDRSEDSRYFGPVPNADVIGEPVLVLWSLADPPDRWLTSQVAVYFDHPIDHLRWGRLFRRVN